MSVTPRDARSAEFAGANLSGPGPLAAGVMSFTTPVPLPAHAAGPLTAAAQHLQDSSAAHRAAPKLAASHCAGVQNGCSPAAGAFPGSRADGHGPVPYATFGPSSESGGHVIPLAAQPGQAPCDMDMSPRAGSAQPPQQCTPSTHPPTHDIHPQQAALQGLPEEVSPLHTPRENIAEVLTGHLHAWGKTLQRLRRPAKSPPRGVEASEPDMQPLGRGLAGQPAEPDLARCTPVILLWNACSPEKWQGMKAEACASLACLARQMLFWTIISAAKAVLQKLTPCCYEISHLKHRILCTIYGWQDC